MTNEATPGPTAERSAYPGHHRLERRHSLVGTLECESALHVGAGSGSISDRAVGSDSPVARDGRGRPYIPGSSFRGALRASLESLLRGLDQSRFRVCNPFEKGEDAEDLSCAKRVHQQRKEREAVTETEALKLAWEGSCPICRLFGQLFLASRVRIADLPLDLDGPSVDTYVRDGVGLDRDLRTAATGILYDFEAVPPGATFTLRMEIENAEDHEIGLLLTGLDLLDEGLFTLGGKGSRGLGSIRVVSFEIRARTARDFFEGAKPEPLSTDQLDALRAAARSYYVEGGA